MISIMKPLRSCQMPYAIGENITLAIDLSTFEHKMLLRWIDDHRTTHQIAVQWAIKYAQWQQNSNMLNASEPYELDGIDVSFFISIDKEYFELLEELAHSEGFCPSLYIRIALMRFMDEGRSGSSR